MSTSYERGGRGGGGTATTDEARAVSLSPSRCSTVSARRRSRSSLSRQVRDAACPISTG